MIAEACKKYQRLILNIMKKLHKEFIYALLAILWILLLLTGCRTIKEIEYRDRIEYKTSIDTLIRYDRDSVYFSVIKHGDTVFTNHYIERWKYKDRIEIKQDTLSITQIKYKEVEKKYIPVWIYWICSIFAIEIIGLILYLYFKLRK